MSILDVAKNTDARLTEVKKLLAQIKRLEEAGKQGDSLSAETTIILKGLFLVHLYGVLEYALSLSVQVLLQEITGTAVPYAHFDQLLFVVALDPEFRSVADAGWDTKLAKRRQLLEKQISPLHCVLNDTVFHDQLQNVWFKTLSAIFEHLCVPADPVPNIRMRGYIDEIVNYRNEIAHGRSSPSFVGRLKSTAELEERLHAVSEIIDYVMIIFDEYLANREFVAPAFRALY